MPWGRLDDAAPNHRKHRQLRHVAGPLRGAAAFGFDFAGSCYCNRELTDGFIPEGDLPMIMLGLSRPLASSLAGLLVEAGRWTRVDGGYAIHDFLDYNKSRTEVLAEREAAKYRQRVRRKSQRDFGGSHSVTSQEVPKMFAAPVPSRPVPSCPKKQKQERKQPPSDESRPAAAPTLVQFRIPTSISEALDQAPRLGADSRLRTSTYWQALVRAHGGVDYGHEVLKAEAWMVANPTRAPKKNLARFLATWISRAEPRDEAER